MSIFDTILLVALAGFVFYGLFFGLIRTLGSLAGVIIGALLSFHFYEVVFSWVDPFFLGYDNIGKLMILLILFTLFDRVIRLIFTVLDRTFDIVSIIPFMKTINRLTGAILGLIMGILVIGLALFLLNSFFNVWLTGLTKGSEVAPFFLKSAGIILFFLPMVLEKVKKWILSFGLI
jgi:uncharacterized membrane protein required for colicin V production